MNEVTNRKLRAFFSKYKEVSYKRKTYILKPGDKIDYIGFVESGFIRVFSVNSEGVEVTIQMFKPMLFFTTMFANTGFENKLYFEAITPVVMWKAPIKETLEFLESDGETMSEVRKGLFGNFMAVITQLGSGLSGKAASKVAGAILALEEIIGESKEKFQITHKLIASMTGMTRETVTLQMLKLEKQKVIDNKNKQIIILDRKRLEEIAGVEGDDL